MRTSATPSRRPPTTDGILDHAAGLFARQGLANTSLRQVAFAAAFSKTGLLSHFPSKQVLLEAAQQVSRRHITDVLARAVDIPVGRERDLAIVESAVGFCFTWPGISALGQSLVASQIPDVELERQGFALLPALGLDPVDLDPVRMVNVTCAFAGLTAAAQQFVGEDQPDRWRDLIIASAMRTLGHADTSRAEANTPPADAHHVVLRRAS